MLTWDDNYIMGIEQLDHEHQQLFKMAFQILEKVQQPYTDDQYRLFILRESITYLHNYFETHVQQEFLHLNPTTSILFTSNRGLFYVASDVTFPESTGNP